MFGSASDDELVSVVVPTYYRNERLRDALDSVADQDYRPIEVVIVDGSGEAHARPVAAEYADRFEPFSYLSQPNDEGPQVARSLGAARADGAYVQFLDDDDRLLDGKFEAQIPLFSDSVGVVYSGLIDEEWGRCDPRPAVRGTVIAEALELATFPCIPSTMLLRREVVEDLLPLGHRHGADDSGLKIELSLRTEFDYVDEPLVERGKPDEALSASWDHIRGRWRLIERYDRLYELFRPSVKQRATRQTYYREGKKRLEERRWSPWATLAFARAAYHTPTDRGRYASDAAVSLFGRPGMRTVERLRR